MSTYTPLTPAQVKQIGLCAMHGIDIAALREEVRKTWPQATSIRVERNVEYDDGQSYYWSCDEVTILANGRAIKVTTPEHETALEDLRESLEIGGVADPEDDAETLTLQLDTPSLDQLYHLTS